MEMHVFFVIWSNWRWLLYAKCQHTLTTYVMFLLPQCIWTDKLKQNKCYVNVCSLSLLFAQCGLNVFPCLFPVCVFSVRYIWQIVDEWGCTLWYGKSESYFSIPMGKLGWSVFICQNVRHSQVECSQTCWPIKAALIIFFFFFFKLECFLERSSLCLRTSLKVITSDLC